MKNSGGGGGRERAREKKKLSRCASKLLTSAASFFPFFNPFFLFPTPPQHPMHAHAQAYRGGACAARAICACACRSKSCGAPTATAAATARLPPAFAAARALTTANAQRSSSSSSSSALALRTLPVSRAVVARVLLSGRGLSALSSCSSVPNRRAFGSPHGSSRNAASAAAAASAEAEAEASSSSTGDDAANPFGSDEALLAAFDAAWDEHVSKLKEHGHWSETSSDGAALSAAGALKHANLKFARARGDAIFSLDAGKITALLGPPLPYVDRKTSNSSKRLVATYVDGKDLDHGEGGPAKTEDVMRLVLAARFGASAQRAAASRGEGEAAEPAAEGDELLTGRTVKSPGFLAAAIELLPELARVMAAEPDADAAARAADAAEKAEAAKAVAAAEKQAAMAAQGGRYGERRDDRYGDRRGGNDRFGDRRGNDRFGGNDRREQREPQAMRPGDWRCPSCDAHNFAARDACFRCGTLPDPAVAAEAREALAASRAAGSARRFDRNDGGEQMKREGDWDCEGCGSSNFSWRGACFRCGEERPASAGRAPASSSGGGGYERGGGERQQRTPSPGDWFCNSCGKDNFARRDACFACGTPRASDVRIVPGAPMSAGGSFGERRQPRSYGGGEDGGGERRGPPEPREGDWACPDCGFSNFASRGSCYRCGGGRPASAGPIPERRGYGGGGGGGGYGGGGGGGYQRRDGGGGGRGYGRGRDGGDAGRGGGSNWSSNSGGGAPPPAPVDLDWD